MKITNITSEVFEWERPGIWNGGHFYGPGRLHKVTVHTDEGITGYGWNGGTAAERPLNRWHQHPGLGGHQHRLLGHQGQSHLPVHPPVAGRGTRAHPNLHRRGLLR